MPPSCSTSHAACVASGFAVATANRVVCMAVISLRYPVATSGAEEVSRVSDVDVFFDVGVPLVRISHGPAGGGAAFCSPVQPATIRANTRSGDAALLGDRNRITRR